MRSSAKARQAALLPTADVAFDCIEQTQAKFQKNDGEMAALLKIAQSNYTRRSYNTARAHLLPLEMRQDLWCRLAMADGMSAYIPTDQEKLILMTRQMLRQVLTALLDFMDQQEIAS